MRTGLVRTINLFLKRFLDIIGNSLGLILVLPIFIFAILLIKLTMPGPIFFTQDRVGKDEAVFKILKLRTMKVDKVAEKNLDFSKMRTD